ERLYAVRECLAFGGVIDTVGIDPAEVTIKHPLGSRAVATHQRPGHRFVGLHHVALRRGLRAHDHNLCGRRNECKRDNPFHDSSYRLKTVLSLKPQASQSQMSAVLDRFLRYVQYDTQSDETSTRYPSTSKQLRLLKDLADELGKLGLTDAGMDQYGYVTATVPPTSSKRVPVIGFIAHVDTSPELTGANVRPIV